MQLCKMKSRTWLGVIFATIVVAILFASPMADTAEAQAPKRLDVGTIKATLAVSEQENQGFIEDVVALTNSGRLSRAILRSALAYAEKQETLRFQYFKSAIIVLGRRQGLRF